MFAFRRPARRYWRKLGHVFVAPVPPPLAQKTYYFLNSPVNFSGNNFLALQDGGIPPSGSYDEGGWFVGTTAPTVYSLFYATAERLAGTFQGSTTLTANPDHTNGDCYVTPAPLSGTIPAGNWVFTMAVDANTAHGQAGHLQMRVFAATGQDGSGARLLSGSPLVTGSATLATAYVIYPTDLVWNAPAVTLANEYLLFQMEWVIETAGSDASDDVRFHIGSYLGSPMTSIVTPGIAPVRIANLRHYLRR